MESVLRLFDVYAASSGRSRRGEVVNTTHGGEDNKVWELRLHVCQGDRNVIYG